MKVNIGKYKKSGEQNIKVQIDPYDTWNMDSTLAHIILPMLIQLRQTKQGSPMIDDEDVPHLPKKGISSNENNQYDLFASDEQDELFWNQYPVRWEWVLNEMIFAFRSLVTDNWDEKYFTGESDIYWEELDDGSGMREMKRGPNDTFVWDKEGYLKESDRIQNGFRLFGKYYQGLWD
jgi:hypothetical protein